MKKLFNPLFFSAIFALGLFSCTEKVIDDVPTVEADTPIVVDYDAIKPTNFVDVPVKEGMYTVVMQNDEVIGVTKEAMTIEVLNTSASFTRSKSSDCKFVYCTEDELKYILPDDGSWNDASDYTGWSMYKTIMFEDTQTNSDYDYNDLIIHVQQRRFLNFLRLYIHPIAMGNWDELSLGADIFLVNSQGKGDKCATIIYSTDVRADLFPGKAKKTFINTDVEDTFNGNEMLEQFITYYVPPVEFTSLGKDAKISGQWIEVNFFSMIGKTFGINWFIINNDKNPGEKIYAVPAIQDNIKWRDGEGRPYGIISADTRQTIWPLADGSRAGHDWVNYPREHVNINKVYKDFDLWLEGKANADWDNPYEEFAINAIGYIKPLSGSRPSSLAAGSKALYDIHSCFEAYPEYAGKNIWRNGDPNEEIMPVARQ